jgi:tape measure domain-containing protein
LGFFIAQGKIMADLNYLINFDSDTGGINAAEKGLNALSSAMAALGLGLGIKELADTADAYTTLAARIKIAVGETGNVKDAMAGVQSVALQTNSNLDATAQLFAKLNDVGKTMGLTQNQVLDLTKTVNQAIQLGGGSAQASEAAITQLSQALQSGVLRGDEFNSIMEQAPGISQALAASLGVTTGELRKMAEEGKLSSQTVVNALKDQADEIDAKFGQFPKTIGQALQNIKTQWEIVVGEFNAESGASAVVVNALQIIGDNLGVLKTLFNDIGDGIGWVSDQFGSIDASTIDEVRNTLSMAYDTVKDLAQSIGEMGVTAWEAFKSVLDSVSPVFAAFTSGQQEVSGLDTAIRVLQVGMGLLSDGAKGLSIILNGLVGGLQFVAGGLSALQAKVARFLGFDDVAKQAEMASDRLFAAGEKSFARANKQITEFKSATGAALDEMGKTEAQKNAEAVANTQKTLADKNKAWQDFVLSEKNWTKERADLDAQLQQARKVGDDATIAKLLNNINEIDAKSKESSEKRSKLEQEKTNAVQAYAEQAIKANNGVESAEIKAQLAAKGYKAEIDSSGKITVKRLEDVVAETNKFGLSLKDTALNAARGLGVDVPKAINEITPAFNRNVEAVRQVADGYGELKKEGVDASGLLSESLEKLLGQANSQKEIDAVRELYVKWGIEGKLSARQVEDGIDAVNNKLKKSPELLDETKQAMIDLGIITQKQAEQDAQVLMRKFELAKKSGEVSAEQLGQALEKVQRSIETSGNASQKAWLDSQKSALGVKDAVEKTTESTERLTRSASSVGTAYQSAARLSIQELEEISKRLDFLNTKNKELQAQWAKESAARDEGNRATTAKSMQSVANYSTLTAMENFLKSAGLSDKQAMEQAQSLMNRYGKNGRMNWTAANGLTEGAALTTQQMANFKDPTAYLLDIAEKIRYNQAALDRQTAIVEQNKQASANRTVNVNLNFDGQSLPMTIDADKEQLFNDFINRLQSDSKRQAR